MVARMMRLTISTNITYSRNLTKPQKWIPEYRFSNSWSICENKIAPKVNENPAEVTMRTADRRTRKAGSSLAYWAFVSWYKNQYQYQYWSLDTWFNIQECPQQKNKSVTDLPILEIAVDLLRSVEQVEHLVEKQSDHNIGWNIYWASHFTCHSANSKSICRKWKIRRRYCNIEKSGTVWSVGTEIN